MNQKIGNRATGLVDYKGLETNILSSIREGRTLTGRDRVSTSLIKKLLEASLEGEIENHLSSESEENNRKMGKFKDFTDKCGFI
ncbi:hypothetical protein [Wolbachia endosymbiont of Wuchereria bancrofti]|uniref:hypothetical protein n=1 Tax=Wolbachia endosymbiont of Wuchereria bancrofti TaxID=96496 RepID=UPI000B6C4360|nr:hypothetical protein [Wolbachia endosymbiont of Wuchereria bancrofti]OWZ25138.1 transposase domain protein [Wolbachia endosymbiont of Wuchereria bancrofti]